jgi:hypothetical protein
MADVPCPRCGKSVSELQNLDPGVIVKLKEAGNNEVLPPQVCSSCYAQLAGSVARGSVLIAREKAKEQKRLMLWKSRVNLIKKARTCMTSKMFSDAAVAYEKYLKVLEVVFEAKPGELTPEHFKDAARTQELTVVASVYWDLLRIYDTSEKYGERQTAAAQKLATFLKFTPILPDIVRKAEVFAKTAKNPSVIKQFLKLARENRGRCFIATAAFESRLAPEVLFLCQFRDQVLSKSWQGRLFTAAYYRFSPPFAWILDRCSPLKPAVRALLRGIISFLAARQ